MRRKVYVLEFSAGFMVHTHPHPFLTILYPSPPYIRKVNRSVKVSVFYTYITVQYYATEKC